MKDWLKLMREAEKEFHNDALEPPYVIDTIKKKDIDWYKIMDKEFTKRRSIIMSELYIHEIEDLLRGDYISPEIGIVFEEDADFVNIQVANPKTDFFPYYIILGESEVDSYLKYNSSGKRKLLKYIL